MKKATAAKLESIHGVKASLLKADVVAQGVTKLRELGLVQDDPKTLSDQVRVMQAYTAQVAKEHGVGRLGVCHDCLQKSDCEIFASCPFCGSSEDTGAQTSGTHAIVPSADAAPSKVHEGVIEGGEEQLNKDVIEINQLQTGSMAAHWKIAQKLADIEKTARWKQRRTTEGGVAYRTMEAFATAELHMSRKYMRDLLRIFSRYTESDMRLLGPSKLRFLLQMEPAEEQKVLEQARQGKTSTKRELARQVGRKGTDDTRDKKKPSKAPESDRITVASLTGKHSVDLFKQPDDPKTDPKEWKPAKQLADTPFGYLAFANDTVAWFKIVRKPSGQLKLVVDIRRVDPKTGQAEKASK